MPEPRNSSLTGAEPPASPRRRAWMMGAVALAAMLMGLPTLRGTFVGGDDQRLVLNHVLVNHPSIPHAIELLTIVHRDLYQPLPLLSFSGEFLVAGWLGLFDRGVEGGAWLFHLDNVLLHAANALLVWLIIARFHRRWSPHGETVATLTALLFAVHPFQVETVAWVNGRMMLLSTFFLLAAVLAMDQWLDRNKPAALVLTPVLALLSAISKVRAGLPLLLGMVPLMRRRKVDKWTLAAWIPATVLTALFVWINVGATAGADLFAEGAEHLRGPRLVRVILALSFYVRHLVWPTCLTSYYPTPPMVAWTDADTVSAVFVLAVTAAIFGWMCVRAPACRFGVLWFLFGIADTLPVFPARNILAADRYMYLPIIGLFWCVSAVVIDVLAADAIGIFTRRIVLRPAWVLLTAVLAVLLGVSWYTAKWYDSALLKTQRVAECFPHEPRVWEKLGWTHHQLGRYREAIIYANKELDQDNPVARSGACQLIGMSYLRLGDGDEALRWLRRAVELDPATDVGKYRLGMAYEELGNRPQAVSSYEAALGAAPRHNPTLLRLASLYVKMNRPDDARRLYERAVENNAFEVPAVVALVELDLADGRETSLLSAERRLLGLLDDLPESVPLRVNLGVVRYAMGRVDDAIGIYSTVLADQPDEPTAAVNLAQLILTTDPGRIPRAAAGLQQARTTQPVVASAWVLASLAEGNESSALRQLPALLEAGPEAAAARKLLLAALRRYDEQRPNVPATYAITAEVLLADGQIDAARAFTDLYESKCTDPACRSHILRLRQTLGQAKTP